MGPILQLECLLNTNLLGRVKLHFSFFFLTYCAVAVTFSARRYVAQGRGQVTVIAQTHCQASILVVCCPLSLRAPYLHYHNKPCSFYGSRYLYSHLHGEHLEALLTEV